MTKASKVTAFQLDPNVAVAPDGASIPGLPGIWKYDEAVHPEALGLSIGEMEDLIASLNAPLVKVMVGEKDARKTFAANPNHLPSEASVAHPSQAGPGFGVPALAEQVDLTATDYRADTLDIMDEENVTPAQADHILQQEIAEANS